MCCKGKIWFGTGVLLLAGLAGLVQMSNAADKPSSPHDDKPASTDHEWALPNESWKMPFKDEQPITLITRGTNAAAWDALKKFWNPAQEKAIDPKTGAVVVRTGVKIKVPLGLNTPPTIPAENPMTVQKWMLGKHLYFDGILSSDRTVSCSTCHDPGKGFTDQSPVSIGIAGKKGGVGAPTVFNSAYHTFQFWDGRAASLEDQSQGPPQNALEMFDGKGNAWRKVVDRVRAEPETVRQFKLIFGTLPTRDTVAKALATYERTVFSGNSLHDRAELAMRKRVEEEGTGKIALLARDYATALKEAFTSKDTVALKALQLDPNKDQDRIGAVAKSLVNGRNLFFNKARCTSCHVGDNFTDNGFHNLGVGVKDGKIPAASAGRFGAQPTGAKNPDLYGAFKTPTLRALLSTAPYMHDGSETTLEKVIDFYDKGGNANEYLDNKMRDEENERLWLKSKADGTPYKGPEPVVFNGKPIIPLKLNLTDAEKKDLVLFLRALQGEEPDSLVADAKKMPR